MTNRRSTPKMVIVAHTALHTGEMTYKQVKSFMSTRQLEIAPLYNTLKSCSPAPLYLLHTGQITNDSTVHKHANSANTALYIGTSIRMAPFINTPHLEIALLHLL